MLSDGTVLILGAGASYDYGFPTGDQLTQTIHELLTDNYHAAGRLLERFGYTQTRLYEFQDKVKELELPTLDIWIQEHPDCTPLAKSVIAAALIPYEKSEAIQKPSPPKKHWYRYLFRRMLGERADGGEGFAVSAARLKIVTFNYDRSLEYYLFRALSDSYERAGAIDLYKLLQIRHVYGSLGRPHFLGESDPNSRTFEPTLTEETIRRCIRCMEMVTEAKIPYEDIGILYSDLFDGANKVCFLGFGYATQNLHRVIFRKESLEGREVYGTAYHLPQTEAREVVERVPGIRLGGWDEDVLTFLEKNTIL